MILQGDCLTKLKTLPKESVDCCITSPPYWGLRNYNVEGQLGLEKTPELYVKNMVNVFREVKRVLKKEGTLWLNLGDSYNGTGGGQKNENSPKQLSNRGAKTAASGGINIKTLKPKDLVGIPWRVAFALQADGWYLRQDIIWHKPNPMPESVKDRCTKAHEYVFLMSKNKKYYFDNESIKEPTSDSYEGRRGKIKRRLKTQSAMTDRVFNLEYSPNMLRNKRSVWTITTKPYKEAHFATFPPDLIEPMVKAGCPKDGIVLDPFFGAGTTGVVAKKLGRKYIGIELNAEYIKIAEKRINTGEKPKTLKTGGSIMSLEQQLERIAKGIEDLVKLVKPAVAPVTAKQVKQAADKTPETPKAKPKKAKTATKVKTTKEPFDYRKKMNEIANKISGFYNDPAKTNEAFAELTKQFKKSYSQYNTVMDVAEKDQKEVLGLVEGFIKKRGIK